MAAIGDLVATMGMNTKPFAAGAARTKGILGRVQASTIGTVGRMKAAFAGLASSMATVFLPLTGAAAFIGVIRSGETFNQKMRQSLAIMGDVSETMKGDMREAAFAVGKATRFAATEAAESYFFLASAGLDAAQSIAALPQVAAFAQAGNFEMARATDLATDAQSALGLTVKDSVANLANMTRVTDVLIKANTLANASAEQFSAALTNKAGPALRSVGKDIEEGVAVLAAFADQGIKSEDAGTKLAIVMRDLQTKAIKNKAAFVAQGVEVFNSAGKMNNMADIIADLEAATGSLSDRQKKAALLAMGFSDKSMGAMMTLFGTAEKIREYEKQLREAGGITQEVADKQLTPLQKIWAQIGTAATQGGAVIIDGINEAIGYVGKFKASFAAAGSAIWSFWSATWSGMTDLVSSAFSHMGFSAGGFESTIHDISEWIANYFNTMAFAARNFSNLAKLAINNFVLYVLETFPSMEGPIISVAATFVSVWAGVKAFFGSIVDNIIGGLKEIKNFGLAVGAAISAIWESLISGDFGGAASAAADAFINTLANQEDVIAPNAFAKFKEAYGKAGDDFRKDVTKSGGLGGFLKDQQKGILADIAKDEAEHLALERRKQSASIQPPAPPGPPGGEDRAKADELPKAIERGSAEAWKKTIEAMYGKGKDKAADKTAKNTERTAKAVEDLAERETVEFAIP